MRIGKLSGLFCLVVLLVLIAFSPRSSGAQSEFPLRLANNGSGWLQGPESVDAYSSHSDAAWVISDQHHFSPPTASASDPTPKAGLGPDVSHAGPSGSASYQLQDTTPPAIHWSAPVADGQVYTVSEGVVQLQVAAADDSGIARVDFTRWDAQHQMWVDIGRATSIPFQTNLDVSTLNMGPNEIYAQAFDGAGNAASSYIWVNRAECFILTADVSPSASGSITISMAPTCGPGYVAGSKVELRAAPIAGYEFRGWSGDATGTANPISLAINSNKSITANFGLIDTEPPTVHWVAPVNDDAVDAACMGAVQLQVVAADNIGVHHVSFTRWDPSKQLWVEISSDDTPPYQAALDVSALLTGWNEVAANAYDNAGGLGSRDIWIVREQAFTLETSAVPAQGGLVSADRGPNCEAGYVAGSVVQLMATAQPGYEFVNWSGDAAGSDNPASMTMNGNKTVTANFNLISPVRLYLQPTSVTAGVHQIRTLDLEVDVGPRQADAVDAYIDFDPLLLEVVDTTGETASAIELNNALFDAATVNSVDNSTGRINFSASKYSTPYLTGNFRVATLRLRARAVEANTDVVFVRSGARWSDVLQAGQSLDPALAGSNLTVLRSVTLNGRVLLPVALGPPGDPRWMTELYRVNGDVTTGGIEVYEPTTKRLLGQFASTTDSQGRFTVTLTDVLPGAYDIKVKGAATLSNLHQGISLPGGEVDFGELLVGDTNGNNCVNGADVSYMIPSFLSCAPEESYQQYSDTNKNGCVNGADVSALIPNFLKCGAEEEAVPAGATIPDTRADQPKTGENRSAILALRLPAQDLQVGDVFTMPLTGDTGSLSADTVDAYIDFNPALLEVVDTQGNLANSIELNTGLFGSATYNRVDNATGQISFSASKYESPYLPNQFTAATIRFRAKATSAATRVQLVRAGPRSSDLFSFGESLDPSPVSATVTIHPATASPVRVAISASGDTDTGVLLSWQHAVGEFEFLLAPRSLAAPASAAALRRVWLYWR